MVAPYDEIALLAAFAAVYSAAAGGLERTPVNGALIFVGFGLLLGPVALGVFRGDFEVTGLRLIAELTLALVLFVDASKADLKVLASAAAIPTRLILIALPLAILLGFGFGVAIFDGPSLLAIAILATILAPTDAALGQAVVTNKAVPPGIRQGLNFESGLNDGVCVPVFLTFLTLATSFEEHGSATLLALGLVVQEIGIGALVGIVVTIVAARVIGYCIDQDWVSEGWMQVPIVATAIACFAGAQALHGSGFIAAFVGGLLVGVMAGKDTRDVVASAEGTGDTLTLLTWVTFGSAVVGQVAHAISWQVIAYSVLALTVMRIVPVAIALQGLPLTIGQKLFIGWFGPRGLATVVFAMMVYQSGLAEAELIAVTATCTVLLSVIAHGVSALPVIEAMFGRAGPDGAPDDGAEGR